MTRIKFFQDSEGFDLDGSAPMDQRWMYLVAGPDELVHPLPNMWIEAIDAQDA